MTSTSVDGVTVAAPAKINLYLHVVGRRPDGYHLLDTLMAFTELADTVTAAPADELTLTVEGPFAGLLPDDVEENLVLRAARALAQATGVAPTGRLSINKVLPVAAGIGGGSSDAAAALKALTQLWLLDRDAVDLETIGFSVGADVPACIRARTVFAGRRGEELAEAPVLPSVDILLVNPGVQLSTATVFGARSGEFGLKARFAETPANVRALADLLEGRTNDLADAAIALAPVIGDVLALIGAAPGCRLARMSGSGATCFGLFDDAETARRAAARAADYGWWSAATTLRA
jgi:4-diphosphocytidyl-2-C-methyl-D-erythritol kinase